MMFDKVEEYKREIDNFSVESQDDLEKFRMRFISRKSVVGDMFSEMKNVDPGQRKEFGVALNDLKNKAQEKFRELIAQLEQTDRQRSEKEHIDLTLPPVQYQLGSLHPLTIVKNRIIKIFERIGFTVADGPEIEDDWHNFSALNFPENHPARDMQDTFFIEKDPDIVLRTHTSSVQVRLMEEKKPPLRAIMPGRVFRNEAISARAHCVFHQVEGLYINESVSFRELKDTLYHFAREMFSKDIKIRFRPSYFPFTEPSAEIDISCLICKGDGCNVCKYTGWVEIAGAGMVDPNVLAYNKIDPETYTGFAFGMGIERVAMLKYEIRDLRLYTENDIRFLRQFTSVYQ